MKKLPIILLIIFTALVVFGGYYYYTNFYKKTNSNLPQISYGESGVEGALELQIKDLISKQKGFKKEEFSVGVGRVEGSYVSGALVSKNTNINGPFIVKQQSDESFVIVTAGKPYIPCDSLNDYNDISTTMVPSCYNTSTQKVQQR